VDLTNPKNSCSAGQNAPLGAVLTAHFGLTAHAPTRATSTHGLVQAVTIRATVSRATFLQAPRHSACEATESRDLHQTLQRLPETEAFVGRTLRRIRPFVDLAPGASVLDLGAAQGLTVVAYKKAGHDARGVEPWEPAIEVSRQLAAHTGIEIEILTGVGEALPYGDLSFDFVHAYSVLEHVDDPLQVFREVYRVLRPGGGFYFSTTSALKPRQAEITGFPLFPWYPRRAQLAIMDWAARERPWLVGYTTRPAIHWFKHREVRLSLYAIGFRRLADSWALRAHTGELSGARQLLVRAAARNSTVRFVGNSLAVGVEYLAVK
jgi:SAM-dependent methyltransferase